MPQQPDLVVFSHLRWNFVWQRPQQILSRLAKTHRIFFVEEPGPLEADAIQQENTWKFEEPMPGVTVCTPCIRDAKPGFHSANHKDFADLLPNLIVRKEISQPLLWLYTPMAFPLVKMLKHRALVYDCMDELSAFLNSPPEIREYEPQLLAAADLVFTGGRSIFAAKRKFSQNVHCFPSSVDQDHFRQARTLAPAAERSRPRLGFFGVIDERMDIGLLDHCSQARPEWDWELVGPVVKIDPRDLPRRENILYRGQQSYRDLPAYLANWDACLLPFALNEATRYISPTKTLEYMAAAKPIISTPIADVVSDYRDVVRIAHTPAEFVAACDASVHLSGEERKRLVQKMDEILAGTSWDKTVAAMSELLEVAMRRPAPARGTILNGAMAHSTSFASSHAEAEYASSPPPGETVRQPVVVIGAGPTGLSCAWHLGEDSLLIEKEFEVGGWCKSIEVKGFTFDYAGHIMFSNDAYVHQLYEMLLGSNVHWQEREAWIYSHDTFTRYPFQGSLHGLPPEVITECLTGAIEARFGSIDESNSPQSDGGGKSSNTACGSGNGSSALQNGKSAEFRDCCGDGILEFSTRLGKSVSKPQKPESAGENFHDFIYRVWGKGIAKHFAIPYNQKLWAVPLHEMETSWLGGRVPMPDLREMITGALVPTPRPMGPNARFGYPLRGGFQALVDGFLPLLEGDLLCGVSVVRVEPEQHSLTLSNGQTVQYEHLVSTMPLPQLVRLCREEAPPAIRKAAASLRSISVRCVHLGIGRPALTGKHWIYYPGDTVFHRIFVQGNASPHCNPPGGFGLTCEITYHPEYKPLPVDGEELIDLCIADCRRVGLFRDDDPVWARAQVDLPCAYVVYDHERKRNVALIRDWLAQFDIYLSGRYSEWEYYNSDHAFLSGKRAAELVRKRQAESQSSRRKRIPSSPHLQATSARGNVVTPLDDGRAR